jgi:hypothetical protein
MLQIAPSGPGGQPTTFAELGNALDEEWNNFPLETFGYLLKAMLDVVKPLLMQGEAIPSSTIK